MTKRLLFSAVLVAMMSTNGAQAFTMAFPNSPSHVVARAEADDATSEDVTSTYLKNADFEGNYTDEIKPNNDRVLYTPEGWTITRKGNDKNDLSCLKSSDKQNNNFTDFSSFANPSSQNHGTQTYWARLKWSTNTGLKLSQTVTLPQGWYRLSADVLYYDSDTGNSVYIFADVCSAFATRSSSKSDSWQSLSVEFYSNGTAAIPLGFYMNHAKQTEQIAGFDNFKLEKLNYSSSSETNPSPNIFNNGNFQKADNIYAWTNTFVKGSDSQMNFQVQTKDQNGWTGSYLEMWKPSASTGKLYTTVKNLPAGVYKVRMDAFGNKEKEGNTNVYIYAGDTKTYVTADTKATYETSIFKFKGGDLEIGIAQDVASSNWLAINNVELFYCGTLPNDEAYAALQESVTNAEALLSENMASTVKAQLQADIATAKGLTANSDIDDINSAKSSLDADIIKANTSISQYNEIKATLDKADNFDEAGKTAFTEAIKSTQEAYDNGTIEDFTQAKSAIADALATGAKAQTTDNSDMTLAINDYACTNTDAWKISSLAGSHSFQYDTWSGNASGMDAPFLEYWRASGSSNVLADATITNTLTGLHSGLYQLSVEVAVNNENTKATPQGISLYANQSSTTIEGGNTTQFKGVTGTFTVNALVEDDGTLKMGFKVSNANVNWLAFKNAKLTYVRALVAADYKGELSIAIENANALDKTTNVGESAFQIPNSAVETLNNAITEATTLNDNESASIDDVKAGTTTLNNAIEVFKNVELNKPQDGEKFNVVLNGNDGWSYDGKAVTFKYDANKENQGKYNIGYTELAGSYYNQSVTMIPTGNINEYYLSIDEADGTKTYIGLGTNYDGGNTSQIRGVDDESKAAKFRVEVTATQDIYHLYNVEANNYIGSQDGGFFTVNSHINFNLVSAKKNSATINVSDAKWATFIAPFDVTIPSGIVAYTCSNTEGTTLTLTEETSGKLAANTPYILYAESPVTEQVEGYALANKSSYTNGLLTGLFATNENLPKDAGNYVLQNQNGKVAFYLVDQDNVRCLANKAYLTVANQQSEAKSFSFDTVTAINALLGNSGVVEVERYNAAGAKVNGPVKGLNIVKMSDGSIVKYIIK